MARTLFDIPVAHEPAEWRHCHVVMEISRHIFSYAVINQDKKLLQLRFYELDAQGNQELAEELGRLIDSDDVLKKELDRKTFLYNFPESQLVPGQYFQEEAGKNLVALFHGDLDKAVVMSEQTAANGLYHVYLVPAEIQQLMETLFAGAAQQHYYTVWIASARQEATVTPSYVSVLFYPNRILVSAVKEEQLQLLQSYAYEAAEDVAYHLLNICQQLQLSPESTPVQLSGMIDISSALYMEMFKYFGQLSLEPFPAAASIPALEEYPNHFFSPLLKLAACVS